jgi:hypothetical protein
MLPASFTLGPQAREGHVVVDIKKGESRRGKLFAVAIAAFWAPWVVKKQPRR